MEAESENLSDSASGVRISITRASWSDNEEDPNAANTREHAVMGQEELDKTLNEDEGKEQLVEDSSRSNASGADVEHDASTNAMEGDEDVSQAFNNSVSISESNAEDASKDKDDESEAFPTSPQLEVVGDRVLIERDGKFELVDVKEIKAEYFDMLGLSPPDDKPSSEQPASDSVNSEVSVTRNKSPDGKTRPKTSTLDELLRRNQKKETPQKTRSKSAKTRSFSRRDEFAHLKSPYGMTEQQIEIKRKREEAIARRKKEEEERRREENRRQREDAERAFEAWLNAKKEEARERREEEKKRQKDPNIEKERALGAQSAYQKWLSDKRVQTKIERQYEKSRREDEAAQYLIRDRGLCDEAFRRWLKKKNAEVRAKHALKKKRKPKLKRKEQPPHNSDQIRYYENYGYRNTIVH